MKIKLFFLFLIYFVIPLHSQVREADFFIAKDISTFEILNRYQQNLSEVEKQRFKDYTPWKIIDKNMILGDRFTHAMQLEFKGIPYYFLLNEDGSFRNEPETFHEIFTECKIIEDEIIIKKQKGVLFREVPFSEKSSLNRIYLNTGVHIKRLFKKGSSYFVQIKQTGKYGWIRISNSSVFSLVRQKQKQVKSSFSENIRMQVEKKVSQINSVYNQLFKYLNFQYNKDLKAPQWQIQNTKDQIILSLHNVNGQKLEKSNAYFVNDIENIISGHPVIVSSASDTIKIIMNNDNE